MVIPGLYFDKIIANVYKKLDMVPEVQQATDNGTLVLTTQHSLDGFTEILVERKVTITDVDMRNCFNVKLQENSVNPEFTTYTYNFNVVPGKADYSEAFDVDYAYRRIYQFVSDKVNVGRIPPAKLVEQVNELNEKWLVNSHYGVELYLQGGDYGDDWRHRIVRFDGTVVTAHLSPDCATGHVYRTIGEVHYESFGQGYTKGAESAALRAARNAYEQTIANAGIMTAHISKEGQAFVRTGLAEFKLIKG